MTRCYGTQGFFPLLVVTLACGCHGAAVSERSFHFTYTNGGEDWLDGECASRDRQSPIDLDKNAPWKCNPPTAALLGALPQLIGLPNFVRLGFAKREKAMKGVLKGSVAAGPSPAPAAMLETSDDDDDADSMLQLLANASDAYVPPPVPGIPGPYPGAPPIPGLPLYPGHPNWLPPFPGQPGVPPVMPLAQYLPPHLAWLPGGHLRGMRGSYPTAPPSLMFPHCGGPLDAFFFKYDHLEKDVTMQNNGHSIATDLKGHGLGGITMENIPFQVLSVNFHIWSEHRFNGKRYPLELHVVHREPATNHIMVVAIPFDTAEGMPESQMVLLQRKRRLRAKGRKDPEPSDIEAGSIVPEAHSHLPPEPQPSDPGFSEALANLMTYPLPADGESKPVKLRGGAVDVISPLLKGPDIMPQAFFQYRGSLTAPPCTEQVTWLVRKDPLIASASQVEILRFAIMQANSNFPNSRSTMPLMGRNIMYRLGINGAAPPPPPKPTEYPHGAPQRHIDFRGVYEGKEAYAKAMQTDGFKNRIVNAIKQAQQVRAAAHSAADPMIAAAGQAYVNADMVIAPTPLPTPDPDLVLNRMVDAVADQLDGAEKAAALAAAGVVAPIPAAPMR